MKSRHFLSLIVIFLILPGVLLAGGFRDPLDSWLLSPLELLPVLKAGRKPESIPWSLMVGQGRLFGMPELDEVFLSGSLERSTAAPFRIQGSWQRTGEAIYRTQVQTMSLRIGTTPTMGLEFQRRATSTRGWSWPAWQKWRGKLGWRGLWGPIQWKLDVSLPLTEADEDAVPDEREPFSRLAIRQGRWSGVGILERNQQGRLCPSAETEIGLGEGTGLGFRVDGPSGTLGLGLSIFRGSLLMRTRHLIHPRLGVTHRFSLGVMQP